MSHSPAESVPLPVILLTGFLGAGKTTLLLRWLRESPATGLRPGIVMNEFGAESVDSQLVRRPDLPVEQVSGGCLCCADDNQIGNAVNRLVRAGVADFLIVETSGLADPDNVIDVLTDHDLLPHIRLQAVVTVVDAAWYAQPGDDFGERILARRQIEFADYLCLSRCDLLDPSALEGVVELVRRINPVAEYFRLPFGLPDLGAILRRPPVSIELQTTTEVIPDGAGRAGESHLHKSYRSLTWRFPVPIDRSQFENFLAMMPPREVVRAKGFVRFRQTPDTLHVFQSVWGQAMIEEFPARPWPDPVMVLIGPSLPVSLLEQRLRDLTFGGSRTVHRIS